MPEQPPVKPPSDVLGSLPRSRPHRRSEKRTARPSEAAVKSPPAPKARPVAKAQRAATAAPKPRAVRTTPAKPRPVRPAQTRKRASLPQPSQPHGTPSVERSRRTLPPNGVELIGTAVQAAAELAEIGLSVTARAIRGTLSRLPRP